MLKTDPVVKEKKDAIDYNYRDGAIKFDNLTFKHYYLDESEDGMQIRERVILKNFDLDIKPGSTNAIVGPSGFGKTTLFNLFFRIYDPEEGDIYLDD